MPSCSLHPEVFDDPQALACDLAAEIYNDYLEALAIGRDYHLGCPTGRSPSETYRKLAGMIREHHCDLTRLHLIMMDEYVQQNAHAEFSHVKADAHFSCHRFAENEIRLGFNRDLPERHHLPSQHIHFPDPLDPSSHDRLIEKIGGADCFIMASGASDGHLAFNPPGSAIDSPTRVIPLANSTRQDNLSTFPNFKDLDEVPTHGVSIGLRSLAISKKIRLVITGAHKAEAVRRLFDINDFDPSWPVSLVHRYPDKTRILLDREAAELL